MADMIKFYKGALANLPASGTNGALYITTDEGAIYLGTGTGMKRLGDFIQVDAVANLPTTGANTSALYYCVAENVLAKWDGSEWTQINKQRTADEIKTLIGLADYATKDYADQSEADAKAYTDTEVKKVSDYVGTIPETATATNIVAYVQEKTAGIATDTALEELTGRVAGAETDIDNLEAAIAEGGSVTNAIAEAKKAGDDAQDAVDTLSGNVGTIEEGKTVAGLISDAQTAADNAQEAVDTLAGKVGTVPADKTVVQMIADAQTAATYDDEEVRGLISDNADAIDAIEKDYLKASDKSELQGNIDTVSGKVTTLVGEDANKSVRTIANEELAKQLIAEDADASLDTLQEIAAWIQSHPDDASAMNDAIVALQNKVDTGDKTVSAYVTDAINALSIGDYAKAADLTELAGRVSALETASATHALKTEVEAVSNALDEYKTAHNGDYTNAQIDAAIDADVKVVSDELTAYKNAHASDYTNEQINNAIANAGHASATDLATHTGNNDIHVTTDDKAKWNAAQANAEATAATALATARTEISAEIDADVKVEKERAEGVEAGLQSAIDTVSGDLADYEAANDAAIALKANAADVYNKTEVEAMLTWGSF